jgi:hypothetical protein
MPLVRSLYRRYQTVLAPPLYIFPQNWAVAAYASLSPPLGPSCTSMFMLLSVEPFESPPVVILTVVGEW